MHTARARWGPPAGLAELFSFGFSGQSNTDPNRRRNDVAKTGLAFGNPGYVRAVEVSVELVMHRQRPAGLVNFQYLRSQGRGLNNVTSPERGSAHDSGDTKWEERRRLLDHVDRTRGCPDGHRFFERVAQDQPVSRRVLAQDERSRVRRQTEIRTDDEGGVDGANSLRHRGKPRETLDLILDLIERESARLERGGHAVDECRQCGHPRYERRADTQANPTNPLLKENSDGAAYPECCDTKKARAGLGAHKREQREHRAASKPRPTERHRRGSLSTGGPRSADHQKAGADDQRRLEDSRCEPRREHVDAEPSRGQQGRQRSRQSLQVGPQLGRRVAIEACSHRAVPQG